MKITFFVQVRAAEWPQLRMLALGVTTLSAPRPSSTPSGGPWRLLDAAEELAKALRT